MVDRTSSVLYSRMWRGSRLRNELRLANQLLRCVPSAFLSDEEAKHGNEGQPSWGQELEDVPPVKCSPSMRRLTGIVCARSCRLG